MNNECMSMIVTSNGDSIDSERRSNALKVTISGRDIDLPFISPWQAEMRRAKNRGMMINSPSVTFLEHVTSPEDFIDRLLTSKCNYETFASDNAGHLINYSFSLNPNQNMTEEIRDTIREIQIDSESEFLFEYEVDINQSVDILMEHLEDAQQWLSEKESSKILVPVVDMKINDEELFLSKLNKLSEKFKRINIIYQSPLQAPVHWGYLQKFLKDNMIWCHMDCVLNRYNEEKISHRVSLYALGISSSSIAYGFGGGGNSSLPSIYGFNQETILYEILEGPYLPSIAERKDRAWINSLNAEIAEIEIMREHASNGTLYTEYLLSKPNLELYLQNF